MSDTPDLDAQVLLAHIVESSRSWVMSHREDDLSSSQAAVLGDMLTRIGQGEPLPYLLGHWEFYNLDFIISPEVLIPRPETELLVEHAIRWLERHPDRRIVVDVGTGSGCIAISLAVNIPNLVCIASDISLNALRIARRNAERHAVLNSISFLQADLLAPLSGQYDLMCANLPYIPSEILSKLQVYKKEPVSTLDGGPTGLEIITRLLSGVPRLLASGGVMLLEIEESQGCAALNQTFSKFPGADVRISQDLAGRDRLLSIQLPD